jgi:capsular polysaccharide transport system permease protein
VSKTDDRIAAWRARREQQQAALAAHGDLPIHLALIASRAEAVGISGDETSDPIVAMVLECVRAERHETVGERRRVYDAIARGFERGIETSDPHAEYAELRRRQLRTIIRLIEADARGGEQADFQDDYRPTGLDEALNPLIDGYRRRRKRSEEEENRRERRRAILADEVYTIAVPEEEEGDLIYLRDLLARVDARRSARVGPANSNLRAIWALLPYQFLLLKSESRVALAWTLVGPAVLMGLLMSAYFLAGVHTILNMDVPTFAMLGSTSWFMLRQIIFRSTAAVHALRTLLNLRAYTPAMLGLGQGLIYMCSYTVVYISLIGGGYFAGLFTLPANVPGVAFWLACIGLMALAIGVIFGSIAVIWPYFSRFAPVIERALQMVSSVILVSEQLPVQYRWVVLWSPLSHAEQLLRSAYFEGYKSEDADPHYFFVWLGVLAVVAFISQRLVRSRSIPG